MPKSLSRTDTGPEIEYAGFRAAVFADSRPDYFVPFMNPAHMPLPFYCCSAGLSAAASVPFFSYKERAISSSRLTVLIMSSSVVL